MELQQTLARAWDQLSSIPEDAAGEPFRDGGWSRKQLLGHLIDSALHNRVRLLAAAAGGDASSTTYDEKLCVELHAYHELPWAELLEVWRIENVMLARVAARVPAPVLAQWLPGYTQHLHHHLAQFERGYTGISA